MFNRRMLVALAACLAVSASTVFAGGNGGSKKSPDAAIYVFLDVDQQDLQDAYFAYLNGDINESQLRSHLTGRLRGKLVNARGHHLFPTRVGPHVITAASADPTDPRLGHKDVEVEKGETAEVIIEASDLIEPRSPASF